MTVTGLANRASDSSCALQSFTRSGIVTADTLLPLFETNAIPWPAPALFRSAPEAQLEVARRRKHGNLRRVSL